MHRALPGLYNGRGVILQDLWEQSFSIMSMLNEDWPVGEARVTHVRIVPANFAGKNFADQLWL